MLVRTEKDDFMQIFSQARSWVQSRIQAPCDDFKQAPEPPVSSAKTALVSAGIGAGVGGALGGGVAYHSVANDSPYFDWVTEQIPLAGTGPSPTDVFGAELDRFETLVFEQSENSVSGRDTLQYLSYLKYQNPKLPDTELSEIYASLEGQLGRDSQVRSALNMISAHVAKHGSTPSEAYRELRNYFGYETDFGKATDILARPKDHRPRIE
mgnify:CR=1 FL=1